MRQLIIKGIASGKEVTQLNIKPEDASLTLMEFLHKHQVPIASSCLGEGVCNRCEVNDGLLSCQITIGILIRRNESKTDPIIISVDYL